MWSQKGKKKSPLLSFPTFFFIFFLHLLIRFLYRLVAGGVVYDRYPQLQLWRFRWDLYQLFISPCYGTILETKQVMGGWKFARLL